VSELIDTYNHERFIEQAAVSAFEQDSQVRSRYWRLIDEFEMPTGVPVLLNTASDLRGEAIVHTFSSSGMGALVLGSLS
jgi:predicted NodU family carbamoyl transferase